MSQQERVKLPVLNDQNYQTWRVRVKSILQQRKVWESIDPGYDDLDEEEMTARLQGKNDDALNLIKQCTNDETLHFIKHCTRAQQAWNTLAKIFCDYTAIDIVDLLDQVCNVRKTENMPMLKYIVKSEELSEMLSEAGVELGETIKGALLLKGLDREKHRELIAQFRVNEESLSLDNVKAKLLKEGRKEKLDQLQRTNKSEETDKVEAMAVKRQISANVNAKGNSGSNSKFICYKCNQPGHIAKFCERIQEAKSKGTVLCYACKEFGHLSKFCTKKAVQENVAQIHRVVMKVRM